MAQLTIVKTKRTSADSWLERTNPLRGLSISQANAVFDSARGGCYARLQYIYSMIEETDPVLLTCVERRAAALCGLGWKVSPRRSADRVLAEEQAAAVDECVSRIDNFDEAVEHLALAFFRGFSHCEPVRDASGEVCRLNPLDSWNFCFDRDTGTWWWNAAAAPVAPGDPSLVEIPPGTLLTVSRTRAIDWPALAIFLRHSLAERDWGRFLERYGIPPVWLTMPDGMTDAQKAEFVEAAGKAADGLSGALPYGSQVNLASEARGTDPFSAFVEHQQKLIVLLATGGTLTSLAEAGSGTLAGNAQMDVWREIVARDAAVIGAAVMRAVVAPMLEREFPGRPVAAEFALGADRDMDAGEVFDLAAKAKAAGYTVEEAELEERTGISLEKDAQAPQGPFGMSATPLQFHAKALQNASRGAGATSVPPEAAARSTAILRDFAADMGPAAEKINLLLKRMDAGEDVREEAARLAEELPSLMPDDPAMAAVIEEAMAEEFAETVAEGKAKGEGEGSRVENRQSEKCPDCGQWLDGNGVCHECRGKDEAAETGENPDDAKTQATEIGKAKKAFEKCLTEHCDVFAAVSRGDIGTIDIRWGNEHKGLAHIISRRDAFAAAHPGEMDGRTLVSHLPETIVRGKVSEMESHGGHTNKVITYGKFQAVLTQDAQDSRHWLLSGYEVSDEGRGYRTKRGAH